MAEFEIGTTVGNMTNLEALVPPLPLPRSSYAPTAVVKRTGGGGKRGFGFPAAIWSFPLMSLDERNALKAYCPGASAAVYIRTKLDDDTYGDFTATMNWPDDDTSERWYGVRRNIMIEFVSLVAI